MTKAKASTVAGLRRGIGQPVTDLPAEIREPLMDLPERPRKEETVRITLDLNLPTHRMLRDFAADSGPRVSAAKVLRDLLAELADDPNLAARVRARNWQS